MLQDGIYHVPVMLHEVISGLQIQPGGTYVDCTYGGGGHSKAILSQLGNEGRLLAFDQDEAAKDNLPADERILFIPHNFRHMQRFLKLHKVAKVHGITADLGVSGHQFNEPERGFSFRYEAALDMRMDRRQKSTAADIVAGYPEEELHRIFEQYGEVTNARTLAATIAGKRKVSSLNTTESFRQAIYPVVKGNPNKYFAQVFQALRIELNSEFASLKEMLIQLPDILYPGARIAIISFHSLEDRIVKNFFRQGNISAGETDEVYGTKPESTLTVITKKPIVPGMQEIRTNPRARSAKLRIAQRNAN